MAKQSIRNLKISIPISQTSYPIQSDSIPTAKTTSPSLPSVGAFPPADPVVILVPKYDFKAEHSEELTVSIGEPLKLLHRPGNGWLLVKPINRLGGPGLIPATYVDILQNSSKEPMTTKWLTEQSKYSPTNATSNVDQIAMSTSSKKQDSISSQDSKSGDEKYDSSNTSISSNSSSIHNNEELRPVSASISNSLSYNGRYWYRVDVTLKNGTKRYLCRYYQDFYKLHLSLLEWLDNNGLDSATEPHKLPKLPGPIPRPDPSMATQVVLKRCNDLHVYINKLILSKQFCNVDIFLTWLLPKFDSNDYERCVNDGSLDNDEINSRVQPTTDILKSDSINNIEPLKIRLTGDNLPPLNSPNPSLDSSSSTLQQSSFEDWEEEEKPLNIRKQSSSDLKKSMYSPTQPLFTDENKYSKYVEKRQKSTGSIKLSSPLMMQNPSFPAPSSAENSPNTPHSRKSSGATPLSSAAQSRKNSIPSAPALPANLLPVVKVKVFFNDEEDIIAIRIPVNTTFAGLHTSLSARVKPTIINTLSYKDDDGYYKPLRHDKDLKNAISGKPKCCMRVN